MRRLPAFLLLLCLPLATYAQMIVGQDTLYGNEWIDYDKTYYRIDVAEDGIYRIPYAQLQAAGLPVGSTDARFYQLWSLGEQQPLYASTPSGPLQPGDYLEFYGEKNRSQLDRFLFEDPSQMLNPYYSLYTDTLAYFLVVGDEEGVRYEAVDNPGFDGEGEEWFWGEEVVSFTERFGETYTRSGGFSVYFSTYTAEGFATKFKKTHSIDLNLPDLYEFGPSATIELGVLSNNLEGDLHTVSVKINDIQLQQDTFSGQAFKKYSSQVNASLLEASNTLYLEGDISGSGKYQIGSIKVRYPRRFNFEGNEFMSIRLPASIGDRLLKLDGLGDNTEVTIIYDLDEQIRLVSTSVDNSFKVSVPVGPGERQLVASTSPRIITDIKEVSFVDYTSIYNDVDYLIVTHPYLRSDEMGQDWVQSYADYRSSADGGVYRTAIVDVTTLYDQFAYGNFRHPLAVRNAIHHFQKDWQNIDYCFLLGKGRSYHNTRGGNALSNAIENHQLLVPTFGYPVSDNLLLAWPGASTPSTVIGRLPAESPEEVRLYLDKVKAFEANRNNPQTLADRAWMKRIIHLGGGGEDPEERLLIRNKLESMAQIAVENDFGGFVESFYKFEGNPEFGFTTERAFGAINRGSSVITFFGHSSPGSFDFSIDRPESYDNAGKTPLMLSLGCYSGNMHGGSKSIGERFVLNDENVTVAFAASQGLGFIEALGALGRNIYRSMGEEYYGAGIGTIIQKALEVLSQEPNLGRKALVQQFNLNGDPALKLHPSPAPDFIFDPEQIQHRPFRPSAQDNTFRFSFDLLNIGRNIGDSIVIKVEQELPNGDRRVAVVDTVFHQRFRTTYTYDMPISGEEMVGRNTYYVTADAQDWVEELPIGAEDNNELMRGQSLGYDIFITDNTARPVWPQDCGIVTKAPVMLKATTTDVLAPKRRYRLEIDTTSDYDSPLRTVTSILQPGGVIRWVPNIEWSDSTTYYWRISPDSAGIADNYLWAEHSFTLIVNGQQGWMRNHYQQYAKDSLESIRLNRASADFDFGPTIHEVVIDNRVPGIGAPPRYQNDGNFINSPWTWSVREGLNVVIMEYPSLEYWRNPLGGLYGSVNTANGWTSVLPFAYPTEEQEGRANLINFLENVVPDSAYVLIYSAQRTASSSYYPSLWEADSLDLGGKNIFNVLESRGAQQIRKTKDTGAVPYVFFYQNGVGPLGESLADSLAGTATVGHVFEGDATNGAIVTRPVGPVRKWRQFFTSFDASALAQDTVRLALEGRKGDGTWETVYSKDQVGAYELYDLEQISAEMYPQLRIRLGFQDRDERKPVFPEALMIGYEPLPELAIDPNTAFSVTDSAYQGAPLELIMGVENLSITPLPTTKAELQLVSSNSVSQGFTFNVDSLPSFGSRVDTLSFQDPSLKGAYDFTYEANPERSPVEINYLNNQFGRRIYLERDEKPPVIDVTFDGRRIINEDIVQPNTTIGIAIWDENPFMPLVDTSILEIRLVFPDGASQLISYDDPKLLFIPANPQRENKAEIIYEADFETSGVYTLQVRGRDQAGQREGLDYEVDFTVVTENTISNVLNYPNPFTTQTQFVYTLTGEPPTTFRIQIATVSGRIVREITEAEIGPLKVGTHRTDYAWNGTDEFGDRLANGVYLYRIIAKDSEGEDYKSFADYGGQSQGLERFFDNGWGKMVLMR